MKSKNPLVAIFLIVAVDVLGFTIILPLLPFYAQRYGASPLVVGVLATSYALCQLLSGPWLGRMSDKIGRRPVLLLSQLGTLVGFLLLAFSQSLELIFLSRIIDGVTAGNLTIAQAAIADVTPPEKRAKSFGLIGIAFGLGFLIGPAISAWLAAIDLHFPALAAAALSAASMIATWFLLPETEQKVLSTENSKSARRMTEYFRRPHLKLLLFQFLIFGFIFSGFTSGFAMFVERKFQWNGHPFGPREVGLLFAYSGFIGLIVQGFLLGRLIKAVGEKHLVWLGFLAMLLGYSLLSESDAIWGLLLACAIGGFGSGVLRPVLTSLVSAAADPREQGAVLGVTQSLVSIGQILAPLISGWFIEIASQNATWLSGWCFWLSAMSLLGLIVQKIDSRPKPA